MNLNTEDLNYLMRDTIEDYHLSIPKTVKNIVNFSMSDGYGYGYTEKVKSITFPTNLKYINDNCFSNLSYLEVVDLSKCSSLESLGNDCFNSSSCIKNVLLPDSLKSIGNYCFAYCSGLESMDISKCSSLETIGDYAFGYSYSLQSVNFNNCQSLTYIGEYCFNENCLTSVDLSQCPNLVTLGTGCFSNCGLLQSVNFNNCSSLETIGDYCFYQCSEIKNIDLSQCNNLIYIGESAFDFCTSLEEVYIPSSTETIGEYCFSGCKSLKKVYIDRITDSIPGAPWGAKSSTKIIWKDSNVNATINITPISDTTMTINSYNDDELVETENVEMLANVPSSVTTSVKQNKMYIANVVEKNEKEVEVVNKDNVLYYAWEGYNEEDEIYEIFYTTENILTPGNDLDIDVFNEEFENVTRYMSIVSVGEDHHGLYLWDDTGTFTSLDCYRNPEKDIYETTTTTQIVETQIYSESGLTDDDIVMNVEQPMPSTVKFTIIPPQTAESMVVSINGISGEEIYLNTDESIEYDEYCSNYKQEYEVDKGTEISYTFYFLDMTMDGRYGDENGYTIATETIIVNEDTIKDFWKDKTTVTLNVTIPPLSNTNISKLILYVGDYNVVSDLQPSSSETVNQTLTYEVPPYSYISLYMFGGGSLEYIPTVRITNSSIYPEDNYLEISDMAGFILDYNNIVEVKE